MIDLTYDKRLNFGFVYNKSGTSNFPSHVEMTSLLLEASKLIKIPYPEVVECSVGETLPRDILGQRLDHAWLLHSQDGPWDHFAVVPDRKVPRADSHQVVKRKLDNQTSLGVHLKNGFRYLNVLQLHDGISTLVNIGLPCRVATTH